MSTAIACRVLAYSYSMLTPQQRIPGRIVRGLPVRAINADYCISDTLVGAVSSWTVLSSILGEIVPLLWM
jgi:hypothetical protein